MADANSQGDHRAGALGGARKWIRILGGPCAAVAGDARGHARSDRGTGVAVAIAGDRSRGLAWAPQTLPWSGTVDYASGGGPSRTPRAAMLVRAVREGVSGIRTVCGIEADHTGTWVPRHRRGTSLRSAQQRPCARTRRISLLGGMTPTHNKRTGGAMRCGRGRRGWRAPPWGCADGRCRRSGGPQSVGPAPLLRLRFAGMAAVGGRWTT